MFVDDKTADYERFVACLDDQLQATNCRIWRQVQISATKEIALFATRISWSLVRVPVHLLVDYVAEPGPSDFESLFDEGIKYSKRAFSRGLLSLTSSPAVVPCIVANQAEPEIVKYVTTRHRRFYANGEIALTGRDYMPALYSLKDNQAFFWNGFDYLGCGVWPFARKFLHETVVAVSNQLVIT